MKRRKFLLFFLFKKNVTQRHPGELHIQLLSKSFFISERKREETGNEETNHKSSISCFQQRKSIKVTKSC